MNKYITKNKLIFIFLISILNLFLISCSHTGTKDGSPAKNLPGYPAGEGEIEISLEKAIKDSISTFSIGKNGKIYLITPDGKVRDPGKIKPAPRIVSKGELVGFETISIFATKGSPIKVYYSLLSTSYCYLLDDVTGEYLGECQNR